MKQFALATILLATPVPLLPSRRKKQEPVPIYSPGRPTIPPAPAVMGQVVAAATGEPLAGVLVAVDAAGADTDVTDEDGAFRVELPGTGRWTLELLGAGIRNPRVEVELPHLETAVRMLEIRARPDADRRIRWVRTPSVDRPPGRARLSPEAVAVAEGTTA